VRWKPFKCNGCVTAFIRCTFHCQNMWNAQGQSVLEWNFTIFHNLHNLSMLKCFATSLDIMFKLSFKKFFFFSFFLQYWGLNSGPTYWATPPALFCEGFLWDRVSRNYYQAGFEPQSSWSMPVEELGLQAWATGAQQADYFEWFHVNCNTKSSSKLF
jgi:hypothetical protein